ncbi:transposase [Micromonospora sp. ATCC 39149]|nr:transposase [Micromonospora sp. ATCC 39149]
MRELAADGIPVAVTCRVLNIARQPYYRWLARPVTPAELTQAHRANALVDAYHDDPGFGYRFLADQARAAGQPMADRTAWRVCSGNGWFSAFGKRKRRGKGGKVGPPVHDDLVKRNFTAPGPNRLWLAGITEHCTSEGKLYLCAIKDVWSNRIVGYSIDSRMKSRLAVNALHNAVTRRGDLAGCIAAQRPRVAISITKVSSGHSTGTGWPDRWVAWAPPATTPRWSRSSGCCRTTF